MLNFTFCFVAGSTALLCLRTSVCASRFSSFLGIYLLSPCPCSCCGVVIWSRDAGTAVPPGVAPPIFFFLSEFGAYSQADLFPIAFLSGTLGLAPWPLVRTVRVVDSIGITLPTSSAVSLAGGSTPGLLTVSSPLRFWPTSAKRQPGQSRLHWDDRLHYMEGGEDRQR